MFDDLANTLEYGIVPESEEEIVKGDKIKISPYLNYHGNSYTAMCNQEGLAIASEFLKRIAEKYKNEPIHNDLLTASFEYGTAAKLMKDFTEIFPFSLAKSYVPSEFPEEK
ncbi:MAG: hypothetical protein ACFE9L_17270 [Candidatus Hodarchaeota archaeon]